MLRLSALTLLAICLTVVAGCGGGSNELSTGFDQDELAKYAAENPAPAFDEVDDEIK